MDSYRRQQSVMVRDEGTRQPSTLDSRSCVGAGYMMMTPNQWAPSSTSPFTLDDVGSSRTPPSTADSAGAPTHVYEAFEPPYFSGRSSTMYHMNRSLLDAPYAAGSLDPTFAEASVVEAFRHGARRPPDPGRNLFTGASAVPAGPSGSPRYPHDAGLYSTNLHVENLPPPQPPMPQQCYFGQDPTYSADSGIGRFPSFPYFPSQRYNAPMQPQATSDRQQHPSNPPVPVISSTAQTTQTTRPIASHPTHTREQASSSPADHLSPVLNSKPRPCQWQELDGSTCGILLDDLTQGGVNRHLREYHGFDLASRAHLLCRWEGCHQVKSLLTSSVGKHVSAIHLREANTLTCNHCPQTFARYDAGMRHVKKQHPDVVPQETDGTKRRARPI